MKTESMIKAEAKRCNALGRAYRRSNHLGIIVRYDVTANVPGKSYWVDCNGVATLIMASTCDKAMTAYLEIP